VSQPRINKIEIDIGWCPNRVERLNQLVSQPRINTKKIGISTFQLIDWRTQL
jgi:hypothetical protein